MLLTARPTNKAPARDDGDGFATTSLAATAGVLHHKADKREACRSTLVPAKIVRTSRNIFS